MGVTSLRKLTVQKETRLDSYAGETVAIDAHHWLFKYITVQVRIRDEQEYTTDNGTEVPNLIGLLRGLPTLLRADITPVFVFDGGAEDLKQDEIDQRRQSKEAAKEKMQTAQQQGNVEDARRYKARTQHLTPSIQETSRELLTRLGIPYVEASGAGEGCAARMAARDETPVTAALSGDYDTILFGSPETVRNFTGSGPTERISLSQTLSDVGLTREQFVEAAILIGTDYNPGVSGIGPKRAVKYLRKDRHPADIADDWDANTLTPEMIETIKDIFLNPPQEDSRSTERLTRQPPNFLAAKHYLTEDWGLSRERVTTNLERFPQYKN